MQICYSYGNKQRGIKEPLDKGEGGERQSWLKTQHSKHEHHGIWSHHFMADSWGNNVNSDRLYFLGSKITVDSDCSHEIKRCLLRGRKAMTNLSSILKSRDITLPTRARIVKAMVFPAVRNESRIWDEWIWQQDNKKGWAPKNWCLRTVVLEKSLESPLDSKIKPINPKGNQSWIFIGRTDAEALIP